MRITRVFTALFVASTLLVSCTATDPDQSGVVEMNSTVSNATVTSTIQKGTGRIEGGSAVTSIRVERVRILLSRLKYHRASDDTTSGGTDVKTGPAVVIFKPDTSYIIFKQIMPNGTYTRVKLEKHKFSSSEAPDYVGDPVFGDFVDPERLTLIIEGTVVMGTEELPFTLTDSSTENLWIDFDPSIVVEDNTNASLDLIFDASLVFKNGSQILDPLDSDGLKDIGKNLKKAFRIQNRR